MYKICFIVSRVNKLKEGRANLCN